MNIIMASDDNYAGIMAASINSIAKNNMKCKELTVYIIDDGIAENNRKKILEITHRYENLYIQFIDFEEYGIRIRKLVKNTNPPLPLITFARLFISEMISEDKVLYVDCDTICMGDISGFWNTDMDGKMIAGVWDTVDENIKSAIGLDVKDRYINAGIILIDLKKWREDDCTKKSIDYINEKNGCVMHNDQGVINALFKDKIKIVEPKYNAMTPIFLISRYKIMKYFCIDDYYSCEEIQDAKENPVFLHFVRFTTSRPWEEKCSHPYKKAFIENYKEVYDETPVYQRYNISFGQIIAFRILNNYPYVLYVLFMQIIKIRKKCINKNSKKNE